jgi:hypothetical protein
MPFSSWTSTRTHTCHWGSITASPVQDLSSGRGCPRLRTQAPEVTSQACEAFSSHVNETLLPGPGTALPLASGRNINISNGPIIVRATFTYPTQLGVLFCWPWKPSNQLLVVFFSICRIGSLIRLIRFITLCSRRCTRTC